MNVEASGDTEPTPADPATTTAAGHTPQGRSGPPAVVLVGPPGAGKSTVGAVLADRLDVPHRDTDQDVERAAGTSIADIFVNHGEEYFRALERDAVDTALREHPGVLALGGGSVTVAAVRDLLAGHQVVFLDVGLYAAVRRVGLDAPRPLLIGSPRARWRELMEQRRPLYTAVARTVVSTDERTPDEIADAVLEALRDTTDTPHA